MSLVTYCYRHANTIYMNNFPSYRSALAVALLMLQGCASTFEKSNNEVHQASNARIAQSQVLARQTRPAAPLVSDERVVRFTTRSVPLLLIHQAN